MSSDNQFTALGPAIIGFQTHGANIDKGADVAGRDFGARGHSDAGVGVIGESIDFLGVFGESINHVGVRGTSQKSAGVEGNSADKEGVFGMGTPGVFGQGTDGGTGVRGLSKGEGHGVVGESSSGHGIFGSTDGSVDFKSHGIFGRSAKTAGVAGVSGPEPDINNTVLPGASGVYGFCAQGRGVFGASEDEEGIKGSSKKGYGGVFSSGALAQLHLEPLDIPTPQGNIPGRGGDLLATVDTRESNRRCSLWFCVQSGDAIQALWVRIAS